MTQQNANYFVNGTTALEMRRVSHRADSAHILPFPGQQTVQPKHFRESACCSEQSAFRARVLNASEMYCSLRYESMAGCSYHAFTKRQIAFFSACSSLIAAIALLFGA